MSEIVNKVANSGLITLDLESWVDIEPIFQINLTEVLYQGLILREADLKNWINEFDFSQVQDKNVSIICPSDVILPQWIYLYMASKFAPYTRVLVWGDHDALFNELLSEKIRHIDCSIYQDQRVIIKGCSKYKLQASTYINLANKLLPHVKSLMYGEACSTVPLFKRK